MQASRVERSIWLDLTPDHRVLELHERVTAPGPALELHVVIDSETDATIAWWADDRGAGVWIADVGAA